MKSLKDLGIPILLDGRPVEKITAFLFDKGGNEDPKPLIANQGKSFIGSYVLGMGFTFDDTNPEATPIAEMHRLIAKDPRYAEVIFPYIGGEEVNSSPTHAHHRYVINFGEMTEEEAREYPDLMAIVEEKVKPGRIKLKDNPDGKRAKASWWLFCRNTPGLVRAIQGIPRVLVIARVTQSAAFTFLPAEMVYSEQLVVIANSANSSFTVLQSQIHEIWARFFGSSLEDRLRYTPSDCFETFPFPEQDPTLETIGKTYYDYRAALMIRNNQGLTDTYNRFHDPTEPDPDILSLRDLHAQMDQAVLNAYGWQDLDITCGFALDYLDGDPDDLPPEVAERVASGDLFFSTADEAAAFDSLVRTGKRKLPWRYKWPEGIHDEVLARLLDLNQKRYEAEILGGVKPKTPSTKKAKRPRNKPTPGIPGLE